VIRGGLFVGLFRRFLFAQRFHRIAVHSVGVAQSRQFLQLIGMEDLADLFDHVFELQAALFSIASRSFLRAGRTAC